MICKLADGNYIIDEYELKSLLRKSVELDALECGGVDNWDFYSESFEDYFRDEMEDTGKYVDGCLTDYVDNLVDNYPTYEEVCETEKLIEKRII